MSPAPRKRHARRSALLGGQVSNTTRHARHEFGMPTSGVEVEACVARDTTQALAQSKCGAQQACRLRATGRSMLRRLQRRGQGMHRDGFALSCASAPRSTGTCWCTWRRRLRHQGGSSCPLMPPRTMSWWPSLHTTQAADALEGEDRRNGAARDAGAGAGEASALLGLRRPLGWSAHRQRRGGARAHLRRPRPRQMRTCRSCSVSRVKSLEIKIACKRRHCSPEFSFLDP
jgi:hypothetical protein